MKIFKPTWKKMGMLCLLPALYMVLRHRAVQKFEPVPVANTQLRVVTWNVGYFALSANKNLRDTDLKFVSETLKETAAQVILLQEVSTQQQAEKIAESLGEEWQAYHVETGHQSQVLSLLTPLASDELLEHKAGGRSMLGLSLTHPSEVELFITGVHAPHPARGKQDTEDSIRGAYAFTVNRPEKVRIFAGDLNYIFDEAGTGSLYQELLDLMADSTLAIGNTYYFGSRIDHVFHAPKQMQVTEAGSGMLDYPVRLAKVPGFRDHRPIVVTYDLLSI